MSGEPIRNPQLDEWAERILEAAAKQVALRYNMLEQKITVLEHLLKNISNQLLGGAPDSGVPFVKAALIINSMPPAMRVSLRALLACPDGLTKRQLDARMPNAEIRDWKRFSLGIERMTCTSIFFGGAMPIRITPSTGGDLVFLDPEFRKVFTAGFQTLADPVPGPQGQDDEAEAGPVAGETIAHQEASSDAAQVPAHGQPHLVEAAVAPPVPNASPQSEIPSTGMAARDKGPAVPPSMIPQSAASPSVEPAPSASPHSPLATQQVEPRLEPDPAVTTPPVHREPTTASTTTTGDDDWSDSLATMKIGGIYDDWRS